MAKGDQTIEYLNAIILEMLDTVDKADWMAGNADEVVLAKIDSLLDQFGLNVQQVLAPDILMSYFGGVDEATQLIAAAGMAIDPMLAITADGLISKPFQKVVHVRAVEKLIDDTMMDMSAAINTMKGNSKTVIKQTLAQVRSDLAQGLIRGDAQQTTINKVAQSFRDRGMTAFTTVDGKQLPLNTYATAVVRTKTRAATVEGSTDRYKESGVVEFVKIVGNGDSCKVCSRYNGLICTTKRRKVGYPHLPDIKKPPFHPNCRCGVRPYSTRGLSPEELKADQKRNEQFARDPNRDRRTKAQKAAYEHEQNLRRIANDELKQFMRWQASLGAEAPKTIGAFRAMKRKNSPKFQELQGMVRSNGQNRKLRPVVTPPRPTPTPTPAKAKARAKAATKAAPKAKAPKAAAAPKAPPVKSTDPNRLISADAKTRFDAVSVTKAPPDMSTPAKKKKFMSELLANSGQGHLNVAVKKINANGQVTFNTTRGTDIINTVGFQINSQEKRSAAYQQKTIYHEFYHAQFNGLKMQDDRFMSQASWSSWEETATETSAHYMLQSKGNTEMVIPSYANHLMKNLPVLKQLDEFADCDSIEDFGAVFMKYRFDDAHKTAEWSNLQTRIRMKGIPQHDVFDYNDTHYRKYVEDNIDEIASEVSGAIDDSRRNETFAVNLIKGQILSAFKDKRHSTGYDLAVMYAMKKLGVK